MSLTKEYLNNLYVEEQENIKKTRIQKIVTYMMELAIMRKI